MTVILDQSWRQPEKGILKNKHEGGVQTDGTGGEGRSKSRDRSKSNRRHGRRHSSHRNSQNLAKRRDCSSGDSDDASDMTADTSKFSMKPTVTTVQLDHIFR